jgi:hypothetical protein
MRKRIKRNSGVSRSDLCNERENVSHSRSCDLDQASRARWKLQLRWRHECDREYSEPKGEPRVSLETTLENDGKC